MKICRVSGCVLVFVGLFFGFNLTVAAQQGASSASLSRTKAISKSTSSSTAAASSSQSNSRNSAPRNSPSSVSTSRNTPYYNEAASFTPPDEVAVEEFVNYHKHRLPLPKVGRAVAMDVRWGNDEISAARREAVLQIGFTTAEVGERTDLRPLNLSLVIDRSGSMAESDKMSRVKESLRLMVEKLRPEDVVSVVGFDTGAQVLYSANRVGDGYQLRRVIDCLQPEGSTNIHAGLMLGYAEAQKNFRRDATNRVILLTDGIANVGVTAPDRIAAASAEYNNRGIDLSTVGVGLELNNDLLRTLATTGRGLYHFVSDYEDIEKVFVNEVQSLVSSVAKRVELSVDADANLQVEKIYGYAPRARANGFSIGLDNMNNGLTQVVMVRFRARNAERDSYPVKVRLSYFDVKQKRSVEEVQEVRVAATSRRDSGELLADVEVKKNYTIAELAQSLFDMTEAVKRNRYREAESFLNASTAAAFRRYPNDEDKDVRYVLNIVENYRRDLKSLNGQNRRGDDCGDCR